MFLIPPKIPFLPKNADTAKLLSFGDPNNLKEGVTLREKTTNANRVIYSLYDLETNTKYITEHGNTVKRISENQIVVKKKSVPVPTPSVPNVSQSKPINIPESASFRSTSFLKRAVFDRASSVESEASEESMDSAESFKIRAFGTSPLSPTFDDFDFLPNVRPKETKEESVQPHTFKIVIDILTPNVPGERIDRITEGVILAKSYGKNISGVLYLTNYQLIFCPYTKELQRGPETTFFMEQDRLAQEEQEVKSSDIIMIPLSTIARFEKVDRQNSTFMFGGENSYSIDVYTKDFRKTIRLGFDPNKHSRVDICNSLSRYIFPKSLQDIFGCSCKPVVGPGIINGWDLYDVYAEYKRLGVGEGDQGWDFSPINRNYALSETYPEILVLPVSVTDEDLQATAGFRSKGRIPVLAWRNRTTGACICRCSQPKTGMSRTYRCKSDEKLIRLIQLANRSSRKLHIMDARPMTNAIANMALGGGYENISYYQDCELEFLGIANIHTIRDSWNKLRDLCEMQAVDDPGISTVKSTSTSWLSQLEATHWFDHLISIINGAIRVVQVVDQRKESVLIHCSDGWDRTPQCSALAQVLLDKEYRTIRGFCILIEKEWLHLGHKFGDRIGLNLEDSSYRDVERSPIFVQFLDATWQIMQQYPYAFEFTESMLLTILEHLYSSRYGTFLLNSEKERRDGKLHEVSQSLWTHILTCSNQYQNPFYQPHKEPQVIYPSVDIKNYTLWKSYYLKYLCPDRLDEYQNKFTQLGKEMKDSVNNLQSEIETLQKENERLIQELKLQQEKQHQDAGASNNHYPPNHVPQKKNGDSKSAHGSNEVLFHEWVNIQNSAGNLNADLREKNPPLAVHNY